MEKDQQWFTDRYHEVNEEVRINAWLANHEDRLKMRHGIYHPHLSVKPFLIVAGLVVVTILAFLQGYNA